MKFILSEYLTAQKNTSTNYNHAATLFVQVLLRLQQRCPGSVLIDSFEISEGGQQIACATLPYFPVDCKLDGIPETINLKDERVIEKLLSDAISDVEFLRKNFSLIKIVETLGSTNISLMREKGCFFLENWAKMYETIPPEDTISQHLKNQRG